MVGLTFAELASEEFLTVWEIFAVIPSLNNLVLQWKPLRPFEKKSFLIWQSFHHRWRGFTETKIQNNIITTSCEAQNVHKYLSTLLGMLSSKVGHTNLVFGVPPGSLVGLCMQDYKFLCAVVTICEIMHGWPNSGFYILTPVTLKSRSNMKWIYELVHSREIHLWRKFGDLWSVSCRDNTHII